MGADTSQAFYGLVAQGRDIASFGSRDGQKDVSPDEAYWAESIVGLFQWPSLNGGGLRETEFQAFLMHGCIHAGRSMPCVTSAQWERLHACVADFHQQWRHLPDGETLDFAFPTV